MMDTTTTGNAPRGSKDMRGNGTRIGLSGVAALLGGAVALLFLAGCAGGPSVRGAEQAKAGDGVAFGRIVVVENGRTLKWSSASGDGGGDGDFWALVVPKGKTEAINAKVRGDGSFAWALAPGEYAIAGYHWRRYSRRRSDRVWATFKVPADGAAIDVGMLKIEFAKNAYKIAVDDAAVSATETFKRQVARLKGPTRRATMNRVVPAANAQSERNICDKAWGIECGSGYDGVRPDIPDTVKSLQPVLKWKGSSRADVRYDVVVYETFGYSIAPRSGRMHGPIVAYAEGLERPEFQMPQPLRPKTKYYWGVRLRAKDTVSNWSRYGSGGFYLVRISSRRNHLYSFDTPAK